MLNDPIPYQLAFLKRLGSKPKELRKYIPVINLAQHNMRVMSNRHGIYMVERHIARREARAKETT